VGRVDLDRLDRLRVPSEHSDHHVVDDFDLCLVGRSDLDEYILCVQCNLAVIAVDDGRKGENGTVRIVDYGVYRRVANDVQKASQVLVFLLKIRMVLHMVISCLLTS